MAQLPKESQGSHSMCWPKDIGANAILSPIHHAYSQLGVTRHQTLTFCSSSCAHDSMLPPLLARIRSQGTIPMPQVGPLPWPTCITLHNVQVPFQYGSSLVVSALSINSMGRGGWDILGLTLRLTSASPWLTPTMSPQCCLAYRGMSLKLPSHTLKKIVPILWMICAFALQCMQQIVSH